MKRKVPARKHHGVRDPIKQQEQRFESIKNKINNPPVDKDSQKVSYKLAQFIKLRDDIKAGKPIKLKKSAGINNEDRPAKSKSAKNSKQIKKLSNETDDDYLRRVSRATKDSIKEAEYEKKYGVNVIRDKKTGKITITKRSKDEIEAEQQLMTKKKHKVETEKKIDSKLAKEIVKQAIKESKLEEKNETVQEYQRDKFYFGEVVHAPPTFSVLPRHAKKSESAQKPAKKNNLILKTMLSDIQKPSDPADERKSSKTSTKNSTNNLKGKRKDLPLATRQMLETQQNKVVELYRQAKKNKMKFS